MSKISPLAYVDPEARIGENCEIGPFCFVDRGVVIGDNQQADEQRHPALRYAHGKR